MVILYLKGGIGNLLFQYAAGRGLAQKLNVPLRFDKSYYNEKHYEEDVAVNQFYNIPYYRDILERTFHINIPEATPKEMRRFRQTFAGKLFDKLLPYYRRKVVNIRKTNFDPNFFKTKKNVLIKGYWQSEKYFSHIEELLREDLVFNPHIRDRNRELTDKINSCESVGIHIRRGDYVHSPIIKTVYGALDLSYYTKSLELIQSKCTAPITCYVFSDDIEWAKENFKPGYSIQYMDKSLDLSDADEMYLMSCCRHNIIANSSFSWWAAWLNPNRNKIVVAPKNWFYDDRYNYDSSDIIPDSWIQL